MAVIALPCVVCKSPLAKHLGECAECGHDLLHHAIHAGGCGHGCRCAVKRYGSRTAPSDRDWWVMPDTLWTESDV